MAKVSFLKRASLAWLYLYNYPEDHQIKKLQREADNKYNELLGIKEDFLIDD